jgi:hypothetical protein
MAVEEEVGSRLRRYASTAMRSKQVLTTNVNGQELSMRPKGESAGMFPCELVSQVESTLIVRPITPTVKRDAHTFQTHPQSRLHQTGGTV